MVGFLRASTRTLFALLAFTPAILPQTSLDTEQSAFLVLINNFRAQNGAPPLGISPALQAASQWMSQDMADKSYFSHTDSLGRDPGARITAFGYTYYPWGENIAAGNSSAQGTFDQWVNSAGHRANMLNPSFRAIGIGRAYNASAPYRWYWTTDFGGQVESGGGTPSPTPTPALPTISSFTAVPSSITRGQSAQLSWSVAGATTVTIDNGTGAVTSSGTRIVAPAQTTVYTLTATNSAGSVTATATVSVAALEVDTIPPTAPVITQASSTTENRVDLTWGASTDNVGVAGYQVVRNGVAIASVGATVTTFGDTTVPGAGQYSYTIRAFDAAGNVSAPSASAAVNVVAAPSESGCAAVAVNAFTGCYYPNLDLTGSPVLIRTDPAIDFRWDATPPDGRLPARNYSVRWKGKFDFVQSTYTFVFSSSDGIRIFIDGKKVIDRWFDQFAMTYWMRVPMTAGVHEIAVEYYQRSGAAAAQLSWSPEVSAGSPAQVPAVSVFAATPLTISAGQSTTLSWQVANATSVTIDNGVGSVAASGSKALWPAQTTTYKLVATNAAGSTSATVTVNVNSMARDTQPPTAPDLTSAVAASPTAVMLTWTAATDNVGVSGYQVFRNGALIASPTGGDRTYNDSTVSAGASYSYFVKAVDAARNVSPASTTRQVTTPAAPAGTSCTTPATGAFAACYYGNIDLDGAPVFTTTTPQVSSEWVNGFPPNPVPRTGFSARWQGNFNFEGGNYEFAATVAGGMRVYIDGQLVINRWYDQSLSTYAAARTLTAGNHVIKVEYYSQGSQPAARLSWQKMSY